MLDTIFLQKSLELIACKTGPIVCYISGRPKRANVDRSSLMMSTRMS